MLKSKVVTIKDDGEDKKFLITRMSAVATEEWAIETFFALANAGVEVPDDIAAMGFAGILGIGIGALGKVEYAKAKPLLDKMMSCIQYIPDPNNEAVVRRLVDSDIQDFRNILKLRKEVFSLHTDFT